MDFVTRKLIDMETDLENVKVGDKVIFSNGWDESIAIVSKVTKTQIHVGISRYRKCNGRAVGAGVWDRRRIDPYSEEAALKIELKNRRVEMCDYIRSYPYGSLSFDDLQKVYNMINEIENSKAHTDKQEDK